MVTICICPVLLLTISPIITKYLKSQSIQVGTIQQFQASTDTDKNILTNMSVQPFTGWTTSPSSISGFAGNREDLESREFVMSSSTGTRVKVSIIPSKRAGPAELQTANDLVWITREINVPVNYWSDTYVDFEITRWGYYWPPTTWYKGCGRRPPITPVIEQIHPEIIEEMKDMEL